MATLAILGGSRAVPEGLVKNWPPITDLDRELVMASLNVEYEWYQSGV